MANLTEITEVKNKIAIKLLNDHDIMDALVTESNKNDEEYDAMYDCILPYIYVDETQNIEMSYIMYEVQVPSLRTKFWTNTEIEFLIVSHVNLMRTNLNGVRTDYIQSLVCKLFNDTTDLGVGALTLKSSTAGRIGNNYSYRRLVFKFADSNLPLC